MILSPFLTKYYKYLVCLFLFHASRLRIKFIKCFFTSIVQGPEFDIGYFYPDKKKPVSSSTGKKPLDAAS